MTTTLEALALAEAFRNNIGITGADRVAAALASLAAQRDELKDAARINLENYEFQRNKADRATAAMYDIHYALKDAGWHPGRTDDKLADIIRARGVEMGELKAELERLRAQVDEALDAGRAMVEMAVAQTRENAAPAQQAAPSLTVGEQNEAGWAEVHRLAAERDRLTVEVVALRGLAATCYAGLGGECDLPENWLDVLNAAANGEPFSTEGLLPYTASQPAAQGQAPKAEDARPITDDEIDRIAALTEKAMEDGLRGFCRTWGWQQFARTLVDNLKPFGLRRVPAAPAAATRD